MNEQKKYVGHNFIVLAPNQWDGIWMNRQHLFSRIGRENAVVYSNGLKFTWQWREAFNKFKLFGAVSSSEQVVIDLPASFMLRFAKWKWLDDLIISLYCKRIVGNLKKNKLYNQSGSIVLYIFHPSYAVYQNFIKHDVLVYHAYDDFSTMDEVGEKKSMHEYDLVKKADFVLTSSTIVQRKLSEIGPKAEVCFLPNGVDFSSYSNQVFIEPDCLKHIPHPRVGYVGSVNTKVDFQLIHSLVKTHRNFSFVFVGRVNSLTVSLSTLWKEILSNDNVFLVEPQPQQLVPSLLASCDVNCIYYATSADNFSSAGYPLKMHECLASGRPLVSSDIESVREFSDVIQIARTVEEWSLALQTSLTEIQCNEVAKEKRIATAKENNWDSRVKQIMSLLWNIKKLS